MYIQQQLGILFSFHVSFSPRPTIDPPNAKIGSYDSVPHQMKEGINVELTEMMGRIFFSYGRFLQQSPIANSYPVFERKPEPQPIAKLNKSAKSLSQRQLTQPIVICWLGFKLVKLNIGSAKEQRLFHTHLVRSLALLHFLQVASNAS